MSVVRLDLQVSKVGVSASPQSVRQAIWIALPVKPFSEGKSRLLLPSAVRAEINRAFYTHVLAVACATVAPEHVVVVSRDEEALRIARHAGGRVLRESAHGDLNEALTLGATFAHNRGASGVLSPFTDLPFLERSDLTAMIAAFSGANLVIAPDEVGTGSNALLMAPGAFPYRHGTNSFWRHLEAARAAGGRFGIVRRKGLMCDVDLPAQYAKLPEALRI